MAYRIVEITKSAECHVTNSQLEITLEEGTVNIPLEDIEIIFTIYRRGKNADSKRKSVQGLYFMPGMPRPTRKTRRCKRPSDTIK